MDRRPNVLLVVIDTLRADHLGAYGFGFGSSPNLDALASRSVVFERAIAAAPSTVPSHIAIMTARYAREIGAGFRTGTSRLEPRPTLASSFSDAGYATAAFVGNSVLKPSWGFSRGFAVFDDELQERELNRPKVRERIAEATTQRALDWLAGAGDAPFLLWVHYQDPHGPYMAPEPFGGRIRLPAEPGELELPVLRGNGGRAGIPAYQAIEGVRRPSEYRSRYADEIAYADHALGRLLAAVDERESGRETIVLVTSDHGEALGEGDQWFVHDFSTTPELAHVPLLLRAPGLPPGRRQEAVGHVDVMPTLLELADIASGDETLGVALGPFLRGEQPFRERWVYCDMGSEVSAYRGDGFVRVTGIRPPPRGEPLQEHLLRFEAWDWSSDHSWSRVAGRVEPDAELLDFVRSTITPRPLELDPETEEQMRALGYLAE